MTYRHLRAVMRDNMADIKFSANTNPLSHQEEPEDVSKELFSDWDYKPDDDEETPRGIELQDNDNNSPSDNSDMN
jgi:hypothetical protein